MGRTPPQQRARGRRVPTDARCRGQFLRSFRASRPRRRGAYDPPSRSDALGNRPPGADRRSPASAAGTRRRRRSRDAVVADDAGSSGAVALGGRALARGDGRVTRASARRRRARRRRRRGDGVRAGGDTRRRADRAHRCRAPLWGSGPEARDQPDRDRRARHASVYGRRSSGRAATRGGLRRRDHPPSGQPVGGERGALAWSRAGARGVGSARAAARPVHPRRPPPARELRPARARGGRADRARKAAFRRGLRR